MRLENRTLINPLEEASVLLANPAKLSATLVAPGGNPNSLVEEIQNLRDEKLALKQTESPHPVEIYNLPSSKGLEADVILVVGANDGLFPAEGDDIEEKARLFYVAMTRARRELNIFCARRRSGSITFKEDSFQLRPSRFVQAIPSQHKDSQYIGAKKTPRGKSPSNY